MEIVINIPEETYDEVKHYGLNLCPRDKEALKKAFKTCKPLPENPTNGDIFKAIFSNLTIYENRNNKDYPYVDVIIGEHDSTCYPKDWWNEQYKRGEEK